MRWRLVGNVVAEMLSRLRDKYRSLSPQVRASFWFLFCSVMQKGISVITTPIFTRLMTTPEYGKFNVFNSWYSIVSVIITLNLSSSVYLVGLVKFEEREREFSSTLQGLTLVLCLAWAGVYTLSKEFWNELFQLTTIQMLSMLVMVWSTAAFTFWMTEQRNRFRYRLLVAVTLLTSVLKPTVGILLVIYAEDRVTARIVGLAAVELACYTGFFVVQMARGRRFYSGEFWRYAVLFNLPLVPHYLSTVVLASSDRIMVQRMIGESAAGIYSLAYSIGQLMNMVNDALNKAVSPWIYQRIRAGEEGAVRRVVYPSIAVVGAMNLALIAVAPELVAVFAPPEYYEAIYVIVPVAVNGVFAYLYLCLAPFEFYFEKRAYTTTATLVSALANVGLNLVCIPRFGYVAAGYTTLACSVVNALIHMFYVNRVCDEHLDGARPYDMRALMAIGGAFVVVGLLFVPTYAHPLVRYGLLLAAVLAAVLNRDRAMSYACSPMGK